MRTLLTIPAQPDTILNPTFSGHETFTFRYAWLKKGIDNLLKSHDIFNREDAMVTLGVGKNMVRSIRHWCLATKVVEEGDYYPNTRMKMLEPSPIGNALFISPGWDPYLEDNGTLWLLHWLLATNPSRATTWYWAFNLLKEQEFTRDAIGKALDRWVEGFEWSRTSSASLKSDLSVFLRTYISGKRGVTSTAEDTLDCPLNTLGLIIDLEDRYRFNNGPKPTLPIPIFAYALLDFWETWHPEQNTLSFREILHAEASPGRVFRLDDDSVLHYLDQLTSLTQNRLYFSDTINLRQVVLNAEFDKQEVLSAYYN